MLILYLYLRGDPTGFYEWLTSTSKLRANIRYSWVISSYRSTWRMVCSEFWANLYLFNRVHLSRFDPLCESQMCLPYLLPEERLYEPTLENELMNSWVRPYEDPLDYNHDSYCYRCHLHYPIYDPYRDSYYPYYRDPYFSYYRDPYYSNHIYRSHVHYFTYDPYQLQLNPEWYYRWSVSYFNSLIKPDWKELIWLLCLTVEDIDTFLWLNWANAGTFDFPVDRIGRYIDCYIESFGWLSWSESREFYLLAGSFNENLDENFSLIVVLDCLYLSYYFGRRNNYIRWVKTVYENYSSLLNTSIYYSKLLSVLALVRYFILKSGRYIFFFRFMRISYLLWLDSLIIDFLQKKSFHNFVKSYILISPDFIENFIFKFLSNPVTIRVASVHRQFQYKESSSTYSLFISFYVLFILILLLFFINLLMYSVWI